MEIVTHIKDYSRAILLLTETLALQPFNRCYTRSEQHGKEQ